MGEAYPATPRTTAHRLRERVRYDRAVVHTVLDEALTCHVAFVVDGTPRVLPTLHVRVGETVYLHGSTGSHPALAARGDGIDVSVAVTLLDGLVFARSQFHHSANYRSVVLHGRAHLVDDDETRERVLTALVDKMATGRAADSRPPTSRELAQTAVLAVPLHEVSAKVRSGDVADEPEDLTLPHWSGVLPLRLAAGEPAAGSEGTPVRLPAYLLDYHRGARPEKSPWTTAAPLSGSLVTLVPLTLHHVDGLFDASRDAEVWKWLSGSWPRTRDDMAEWVLTALRSHGQGSRVPWTQLDAATGAVIGCTSFIAPDPTHRTVEIGYTWLASRRWRTGVNTEAKLLVMGRAFETLGAERVTWRTDLANDRSQQAIARLGATREGVLRSDRQRADGSRRDTVVFGMTAAEWPAARDLLQERLRTT